MRKSEIKWHLCDKEQPKKTGSYLVSSKRNPGRVFQSRYYAPQTWSNGYRLEGGWSLRHPRGERVKIYCWAELPEAPMPDEFCQKPTVTRKKKTPKITC